METRFTIIGVHPIENAEPCHLIEVIIRDPNNTFTWDDVTQEEVGQLKENWQVAYDEQLMENSSETSRFVFFFHYLDLSKPLITSFGKTSLPEPTPIPSHLKNIKYYSP